MNVAIITSSSTYEPRAEKIGSFFEKYGAHVLIIESDFLHREKIKGRISKPGHLYIDTVPYSRNLSLKRLYSHYDFAKKAFKQLKHMEIDILYIMLPANSLAKFAAQYKKGNHIKLIFDIIDLWPESLPMNCIKKIWPITCWRNIRNKNLPSADLVITECELYRKILQGYISEKGSVTVYWPKKMTKNKIEYMQDKNNLHLCYLGSINNIIDIDFIVKLLRTLNMQKHVKLHIIGSGENKTAFLEKLEKEGIETIYYGIVYDEKVKQNIFNQCSYGLNIMKDSVCVGVTMKSVDYMCAGLPLINNIKGDTWDLIEQHKIGVNCDMNNMESTVKRILYNVDNMKEIRAKVQQIYTQAFSETAFEETLKEYIIPLCKEQEA